MTAVFSEDERPTVPFLAAYETGTSLCCSQHSQFGRALHIIKGCYNLENLADSFPATTPASPETTNPDKAVKMCRLESYYYEGCRCFHPEPGRMLRRCQEEHVPGHKTTVESRSKAGTCEHHVRIDEQRMRIDEHRMIITEHRKWIDELEKRVQELDRLVAQKFDFADTDSSDRRRRYCERMRIQEDNTEWPKQ